MIDLLFASAIAAQAAGIDQSALNCWKTEADRLASDSAEIAQLRQLPKYEATRMLWSASGDAPACRSNHASDASMNAAYEHARQLVMARHLYKD